MLIMLVILLSLNLKTKEDLFTYKNKSHHRKIIIDKHKNMLAEYISDNHSYMLVNKSWLKIKAEFKEVIKNKEMHKNYDLYYFLK